jgi:hypothetical protein
LLQFLHSNATRIEVDCNESIVFELDNETAEVEVALQLSKSRVNNQQRLRKKSMNDSGKGSALSRHDEEELRRHHEHEMRKVEWYGCRWRR